MVKFCMFLVIVVSARCLLKILFLTLNGYFEKKLILLLLNLNYQAIQALELLKVVGY